MEIIDLTKLGQVTRLFRARVSYTEVLFVDTELLKTLTSNIETVKL